jgi:hypothetical protein
MKESEVKSQMVIQVKKAGGYARRLEDRYGLGIPDCLFMPKGCPAIFFAEVKMIEGLRFAPTDRQLIELMRINAVGNPCVCAILIGWKNHVYYFHEVAKVIEIRDCFSVTTHKRPFDEQLTQFYFARLKK